MSTHAVGPSFEATQFSNLTPAQLNALLYNAVQTSNQQADAYSEPDPAYRGLTIDPLTGLWEVRTDMDNPLTGERMASAQALLRAELTGQANSYSACANLWRQGPYCEDHDFVIPWPTRCKQSFMCRPCGSSKGRMMTLKQANPALYNRITKQKFTLLTFTSAYPDKAASPQDLKQRYVAAKVQFKVWRAKLESMEGYEDSSYYLSPVLDPAAAAFTFCVIYQGRELPGNFRSLWSGSKVTSKIYDNHDGDNNVDGLKQALRGCVDVLLLEPEQRIAYVRAFRGVPLAVPYGGFRGLRVEEEVAVPDEPRPMGQSDQPALTKHGLCPNHLKPLVYDPTLPLMSANELMRKFDRVDFAHIEPARHMTDNYRLGGTNSSTSPQSPHPPPN